MSPMVVVVKVVVMPAFGMLVGVCLACGLAWYGPLSRRVGPDELNRPRLGSDERRRVRERLATLAEGEADR